MVQPDQGRAYTEGPGLLWSKALVRRCLNGSSAIRHSYVNVCHPLSWRALQLRFMVGDFRSFQAEQSWINQTQLGLWDHGLEVIKLWEGGDLRAAVVVVEEGTGTDWWLSCVGYVEHIDKQWEYWMAQKCIHCTSIFEASWETKGQRKRNQNNSMCVQCIHKQLNCAQAGHGFKRKTKSCGLHTCG